MAELRKSHTHHCNEGAGLDTIPHPMDAFETPWRDLIPFTPRSAPAPEISVRLQRQAGALSFQYALRAEMAHVRVPPAAPADSNIPGASTRAAVQGGRSGRADGLWNHTCFEAFIGGPGIPGYYEFNFSPSGQWAVYRFDSYRKGMSPAAVSTPPHLTIRRSDVGLELKATIRLHDLKVLQSVRTLKLALSAVLEDDGGNLSYWALKHAPDKPDFHYPDGFVLELPL